MNKDNLYKKLSNSIKNFDSEWDSIEDFYEFAKEYIFLKESTYDGWYCISKNEFRDVYYQERGCKHWNIHRFINPILAVIYAISCSQSLGLKIKEDQLLSTSTY